MTQLARHKASGGVGIQAAGADCGRDRSSIQLSGTGIISIRLYCGRGNGGEEDKANVLALMWGMEGVSSLRRTS